MEDFLCWLFLLEQRIWMRCLPLVISITILVRTYGRPGLSKMNTSNLNLHFTFSFEVLVYLLSYISSFVTHTDRQVNGGVLALETLCWTSPGRERRLPAARRDVSRPPRWHHWCNPEHWLTAVLGRGRTDREPRPLLSRLIGFSQRRGPKDPSEALNIHLSYATLITSTLLSTLRRGLQWM